MRRIDLHGRIFGHLSVLGYSHTHNGSAYWLCRCECGTEKPIAAMELLHAGQKSCGCGQRRGTHGKTGTPEYRSWAKMCGRCHNPRNDSYVNYGGRGIVVCAAWRHSFVTFLADMGERPTPAHTLERRNNNRSYSPANCRWATRREQNRNHRRNRRLTLDGETRLIVEWAEHTGIPVGTLHGRLKHGWPIRRVLTEPVGPCVRVVTLGASSASIAEWSRRTGINVETLRSRIRKGLSAQEVLAPVTRAA